MSTSTLTPAERTALDRAVRVAAPPPDLTLSQWAEQYYRLSPESAAQPGAWRCYPYQRGIMDAISDLRNHTVTIQKSARVGYTKTLNAAIGYHIHQDPCPMLIVQPAVEDAQGYSKDELAPMIRDCECIRRLVSEEKTRDSENTILRKLFPGGQIVLTGANSARGFRRITVRKVFFDEVDGYPVGGAGDEGDQILLGRRRTDTFWNRQIVLGSTPTIRGLSRIEASYADSDQRKYYVPCPFCSTMQTLEWGNLDWKTTGTVDDPRFRCVLCGQGFGYEYHHRIIEAGEWRATQPFTGHAGFLIWAAYSYSPAAVWSRLVAEWYESNKDPVRLRTFVNTVLAQTWEEESERVDDTPLMLRAENYGPDSIPDPVLVLTAGVDIQADRIAIEVVGWARDESWSVFWDEWYGDPTLPEVYAKLDAFLLQNMRTADGRELQIAACCIDSGHATKHVYEYCKPRATRRIFAVKGRAGTGLPIAGKPHRSGSADNTKLVLCGVDTAKGLVYARLRIEEPGAGYCHFPKTHPADYYAQLTAEKLSLRYVKGFPRKEWRLTAPGKRNEALDCRVYAMCALDLLRPHWKAMEDDIASTCRPGSPVPQHDTPQPTDLAAARRAAQSGVASFARPRGGGWATRW